MKNIKFIDLFAGMGGLRLGFEEACHEQDFNPVCVLTSEIKPAAIKILKHNFKHENLQGDITKIDAETIPDFDVLLGGFPCQAFSTAGKQYGFADTRGTLFFEIERILAIKRPSCFILENVEGLITHNKGNTLKTILNKLEELGYKVTYQLLNSQNFGVAQARKRIFIVGSLMQLPNLDDFLVTQVSFSQIEEKIACFPQSDFVRKIFDHYEEKDLYGKNFKDKRGGKNNIHSWDIELKGSVSQKQKELLELLLKERRYKKWSAEIGIDWMDGIPLTLEQIRSFYDCEDLEVLLTDLVSKGYLVLEYPKKLVKTQINGSVVDKREYDTNLQKGYNIVTGKLSFPFSVFVNPEGIVPTLTATDILKIGVVQNNNIRTLTDRETLRLFGYPEEYSVKCFDLASKKEQRELFDLLGNTVVVPVVKEVSKRILECIE